MSNLQLDLYKQVYKNGFEAWRKRQKAQSLSQSRSKFLISIRSALKIEILFDADIIQVLKSTIELTRKMNSVDYLNQHLNDLKEFTDCLHRWKFIEKDHRKSLFEAVAAEKENNHELRILTLSRFLLSCDTEEDFKVEWIQHSPIEEYDIFWEHHLALNNQSIKGKLNVIYESFRRLGVEKDINYGLIAQLEKYFGNMKGNTLQQIQINKMLTKIVEERQLRPNSRELLRFEEEYRMVQGILEEFRGTVADSERFEMKIAKFGSLMNGFASGDADLDITILTNCYIEQKKLVDIISNYFQFKLSDTDYSVKQLPLANTPIIQLIDKKSLKKIDIAINNICGIINSKFLKVYSDMDPGIKGLGVLLKLWGKKHDLISPSKMSSYSIILMMLYYLIKINVIPCILIDLRGTDQEKQCIKIKRTKREAKEEFRIYNTFDVEPKKKVIRFNILQHLLGFMNFYKQGGRYFQQGHAISLDLTEKPLENDKIFTIKDPFDEPHNPGRWGIGSKHEMMSEIRSAITELESMKIDSIKSLFV